MSRLVFDIFIPEPSVYMELIFDYSSLNIVFGALLQSRFSSEMMPWTFRTAPTFPPRNTSLSLPINTSLEPSNTVSYLKLLNETEGQFYV